MAIKVVLFDDYLVIIFRVLGVGGVSMLVYCPHGDYHTGLSNIAPATA